jgi:hypothetical protein
LIADELRASRLSETAEIVRERLIQAELDGDVAAGTGVFEVQRELIANVPFEQLRAARFVGVAWVITFTLLVTAARFGDPDAVFMLQRLESFEDTRYVINSTCYFSNPQEITSGLIGLATNELTFSTTWELCRQTLSLAAAVYNRAAEHVYVVPGSSYEPPFTGVVEEHSESWPDEVPEIPPLTVEELWGMASDPVTSGIVTVLGPVGRFRDH